MRRHTPPPRNGYSQSKKDAQRLLLPFVVTMLMLSLWGFLQAISKHNWILAMRHPLSMLWASADTFYTDKFGLVYAGPMWFLLALFWIREIFYYGAGVVLIYVKQWADEIIVVACVLVSLIVVFVRPYLPNMPFCIWQGLSAIEFYAIGWYVHRHKIPSWLKIICIVCWPLAIIYGQIELEGSYYGCYPLDVLGACGAVSVLYYAFDWISKKITNLCPQIYTKYQTPLQWLGINSLAVLCMHTFELHSGVLFSVLCRLPFEVSTLMLICTRMGFAILFAWMATKIPYVRNVFVPAKVLSPTRSEVDNGYRSR